MSFEGRLRGALDRASQGPIRTTDEVLVALIATHHSQRRQRGIRLAAAAAVAIAAVSFGDGAVRWIQGLEEKIPPADRTEHLQKEGRSLEQEQEQRAARPQYGTETRRGIERTLPGRRGFFATPPEGIQESEGYAFGNQPDSTSDGGVAGPRPGSSDAPSASEPIYNRTERQDWSHTDTRRGKTSFTLDNDERFIRVRLWGSGGLGTSRGIRAELYGIVDGETELLKEFCTYSGLVAVRPGAEIEVRAIEGGCDGNNFTVKGTTSVRFYR